MQQSNTITKFCRDYMNWFNKGTPSHEIFSTRNGLCRMWMDYLMTTIPNGEVVVAYAELKAIFKNENLDHMFPFNASHAEFIEEMHLNKSHLNEKRINWIMEHAKLECV